MLAAPSVLVYGRHEFFLASRVLLLEREGFLVYLALDHDAFRLILRDTPINILILCRTLSENGLPGSARRSSKDATWNKEPSSD
jgi:hypothetical protein